MRMIFIANRYAHPLTGGEIVNSALCEGACNAGFQVVSCAGEEQPKFFRSILGLMLVYIIKVLRSKSSDLFVVDADYHFKALPAVLVLRYIFRRPVVVMLHHYNYWDKKNNILRFVNKLSSMLFSKSCTVLITVSRFSFQNFLELSGKNIPHYIINPFTDSSKSTSKTVRHFDGKIIKFLHVGHIMPRKNLLTVIEAFRLCTDVSWEYHLVGIVLDENYLSMLKSKIEKYNLQKRIFFHGRLSDDSLVEKYKTSDVFILASIMEGFGIVYAEAMRYGLPIIASKTGAVPEIVQNEENGFLCNPDDALQIADAIKKMSSRATREKMSQNNVAKFATFNSREKFINESCKIFTDLLKL